MVRVLIKGFGEIPQKTLEMMLRPFGSLRALQISGATAVADFETMDEAKRAVAALHGRAMANASVLSLDVYYSSRKRVAVRNEYPLAAVLRSLEGYGKIYNVKETPAHIFVDFFSEADAAKVLEARVRLVEGEAQAPRTNEADSSLKPVQKMDSRAKYLRITKLAPASAASEQTVFLYNLPANFDECDLVKHFEKFGDVVSCGVQGNRGYVNYARAVSALRAFRQMEGKRLKNTKIRVKIKGRSK